MLNEVMNPAASLHKSEAGCPNSPYSVYDDDLAYILSQEDTERIDLTKFVEYMKEFDIGPVGICSICNKHYTYGGYNAQPVVDGKSARCCTRCHDEIVEIERSEETSNILHKTIGRKPLYLHKLHSNPGIIINHVERVDTMRVIAAPQIRGGDETIYDFVDAEYQDPFFIFKQADSNDVVIIDKRKIISSYFLANHELLIHVEGEFGPWRFCPYYDEISERKSSSKGNNPLHPQELKDHLVRTAVIESYTNQLLSIGDSSIARAYVRLKIPNHKGKNSRQVKLNDNQLDISVGNDNEQLHIASIWCFRDFLEENHEYTSEAITHMIARELLEHLFTTERRNESNEQISAALNSDLSSMAEQKTIPTGGDENGKHDEIYTFSG